MNKTATPSRTQPAGTACAGTPRTQATAKAGQLDTASASILTAARFALTSEQEHSLGGWSRTSQDASLGITEIVYQETRKMPIRRLLYVDGSNTGYADEAAFEAAYRAANAAKQAEPRRTQPAGTLTENSTADVGVWDEATAKIYRLAFRQELRQTLARAARRNKGRK